MSVRHAQRPRHLGDIDMESVFLGSLPEPAGRAWELEPDEDRVREEWEANDAVRP